MRTTTRATALALALLACKGSSPEQPAPGDPVDTDEPGDTDEEPTAPVEASATFTDAGSTATVQVADLHAPLRTYDLQTDHPLRDDGLPTRVVEERADQPTLRSGDLWFDALWALGVDEMLEASVDYVRDGAFADGAPVPCPCFETGEKWTWVWTRDTAYAADLALALLDPVRTADSLRFKLSTRKLMLGADQLQIVQDTGTGGSWPVSTDRTSWAVGARAVLATLSGPERSAFAAEAREALVNTVELDRVHAFDEGSGLYRGEQSFLDWREQSYPMYTSALLVPIAESRSLSTNLTHLEALRLVADLSDEAGDPGAGARYRGWADALSAAIDDGFWDDEEGAWLALRMGPFDPALASRRDLLGQSLAVMALGRPDRSWTAVSTYPHARLGPPVMWPQQPLVPVYHNRALWPFVTAYSARAARHAGHAAAFDRALFSLVRGAALNLSHMENYEFLTGDAWHDDGDYSGPTVNSRRQLWSVAGHLGAVLDLFGVTLTDDGLAVAPFVTPEAHASWLGGGEEAVLAGLPWRGHRLDVALKLPAQPGGSGPYQVVSVTVDGAPVTTIGDLSADARVVVELAASSAEPGSLAEVVDDGDHTKIFAPREPVFTADLVVESDRVVLAFDAAGEAGVVFDIFRDGERVAEGVTGPTWADPDSGEHAIRSYCYVVASRFPETGHTSHHSTTRCWWGPGKHRIGLLTAYDIVTRGGGSWSVDHGRPHHGDWGDPIHTLEVPAFRPRWSGPHRIQAVFSNGAGPLSTGLAAGHKRLTVREAATGLIVGEGSVVMPHSGGWGIWQESSSVEVPLQADTTYTLTLTDAPNMTELQAHAAYNGAGGGTEGFNRVNVAEFKLLPLSGVQAPAPIGVAFDGEDDLGKLDIARRLSPGAPMQAWSTFGLDWDDEWLYVAVVSEAFADPWAPFVLYVEASADPLGPAAPGEGMEYGGLIPALPFTPTHAISFRQHSDDGSGPWNGVRAWDGLDWALQGRLQPGVTEFLAGDHHTMAVKIRRALLGDAAHVRLAGHVVWNRVAEEWKETVPASHTPWAASGAGYYEIDLGAAGGVATWAEE